MVKGKAAYFVLGIIVVTAIVLQVFQLFSKDDSSKKQTIANKENLVAQSNKEDLEAEQNFVLEGEKIVPITKTTSTEEILKSESKLAVISEPRANSVVSSPLVVKGEAPGTWFFEASFPVKLLDSDGNLIITSPASAQSDPLTEDFVPYASLLEFNTTATSGYLVLTNDNPSGLPENELSVKIPVSFLNK